MSDVIASSLIIIGSLFALLASIGVARLPDIYCRLSAMSKAAPFGIAFLLAGASVAMSDVGFAIQAATIVVFLTLTSPLASHALGRAAFRARAPAATTTASNTPADDFMISPGGSGDDAP